MFDLSALERLPVWIHVRDLDFRVIWSTRASTTLFDWEKKPSAPENEAIMQEAADACRASGMWVGSIERTDRSGNRWNLTSHWSSLSDASGQPTGYFVFEEDATMAAGANEQLLRAQRMESIATLAGGVAHDMNNVLGPILLASELIRKRVQDPWVQEKLKGIETSARRGADVIKQVLDFSRGVEGEKIPVQIRHVLKELATFAEHTFAKSIRISGSYPRELPPILGDAAQLRQAILNLMVNARDAMSAGGSLQLAATAVTLDAATASNLSPQGHAGSFVRVDVVDTGRGVDPEVVDRLFEPFFTTKPRGQGTGLGLSTTLSIVQSHGGFMAVDSRPNQGSTFSLFLPLADSGDPQGELHNEGVYQEGNGRHILVVDDEPMMLEMTVNMLEMAGFRVSDAAHGKAGLDLFEADPASIDLVITDINMPVMDGPTMIRELHLLRPELPVIATSGLSESIHAYEGTDLGGIQILQKPYSIDELLRIVNRKMGELNAPPGSANASSEADLDREHSGKTLSDSEFDQLMGGDW